MLWTFVLIGEAVWGSKLSDLQLGQILVRGQLLRSGVIEIMRRGSMSRRRKVDHFYSRPVFRVTVVGVSMVPTIVPGEKIFCVGLIRSRLVKPGAIVVAHDPRDANALIIKRVESVDRDRKIFVLGDNAGVSNDSRQFGAIAMENVEGCALFTYSPKFRLLCNAS